MTPEPDIQKRLKADTDGVRAEITGLEKKLHYLEMTDKNSREHIEKIFSSTGR